MVMYLQIAAVCDNSMPLRPPNPPPIVFKFHTRHFLAQWNIRGLSRKNLHNMRPFDASYNMNINFSWNTSIVLRKNFNKWRAIDLPSVLILRLVLTKANKVALNITVPSLLRGMFMVTNRCNKYKENSQIKTSSLNRGDVNIISFFATHIYHITLQKVQALHNDSCFWSMHVNLMKELQ